MAKKAPKLKGWALPWIYPTGPFIRDYLKEHGVGYAQEIWRQLKIARQSQNITTGSYDNFRRNYIWVLKKLDLIEEVKRETVQLGWYQRRYYRIARGKENDPRWERPQIALDPRRGASQFRRKYGRPKKKPRIPAVAPYPWLSPEELSRIWTEAERFLAKHRYTITREDLEQIVPGWGMEAAAYPSFKERVGYVIHEAVEIEEVSLVARRLIDPRLAPGPVAARAHEIADRMEKEWLLRYHS